MSLAFFNLSGFVLCVIFVYILIWSSGKSVMTRIIYSVSFPVIPTAVLFCIILKCSHELRMSFGYRHTIYLLDNCLQQDKNTIEDRKISDVLRNFQNSNDLSKSLCILLPVPASSPSGIISRDDKIILPAVEQEPEELLYHTFPENSGKVDYGKVPGFAARTAMLETQISNSYWQNKGVIVTGQLKVENAPGLFGVASRTTFLTDGIFAHPIYPSRDRELQFFKSGYEPLTVWLNPGEFRDRKRVDLGVIILKKAKKTFSMFVKLKMANTNNMAVFTLRTGRPAPTWRDWGHECAAPMQQTIVSRKLKDGDIFHIEGLSSIPYQLTVTASGYIKRVLYFTGDKDIDLGELVMIPSHRITFRQRPFTGGTWETTTLELNGNTSLVIGPKDKLGNIVDLELTPDRNSNRILAFFTWHPVYFDDYGAISPDTAERPVPKHYEGTFFLEPGHLYRIKQEDQKINKLIYIEK